MSAIVAGVAAGVSWCFCSACSSLLQSCCGNDKPSTMPPGATSGRKRSVFLFVLSIVLALGFQYGLAPTFFDFSLSNPITEAWKDGCEGYATDELQLRCMGNNGNFRVCASTVVFFLLAGIAAALKPTANREAWPAKYVLYVFLVIVTVFLPNDPMFSDIYLNVARVGGALFIVAQQFIILDMAYNWNDSWVEKSNRAEMDQPGSGKKWLYAILVSCAVCYIFSLAILIYMFVEFTGCSTNNSFISMTFVLVVLVHAGQLSGEEGSLLSTSIITAWACFLCYTAVARNPNTECNPNLGEDESLTVILGLVVTIASLGWAGWSYTAEDIFDKSKSNGGGDQVDPEEAKAGGEKRKVGGVVTGTDYGTNTSTNEDSDDLDDDAGSDPTRLSNSWRLNLILAGVACWKSMILTHWGEISGDGSIASSTTGELSMWIIIGSQWFALAVYVWTLIAPRIFPDRDFS